MQYKIKVLLPGGAANVMSMNATTQDDAHRAAAQNVAVIYQDGDPTIPKGTTTTIVEPIALRDSTRTF